MKSLTSIIQQEIDLYLAERVEEANSAEEIYHTAGELRAYLSNPKKVVTLGFIIRRHIQAKAPDFLREYTVGEDYQDLTRSDNEAWPAAVIHTLAAKLSHLGKKEHGFHIPVMSWEKYLTDAQIPQRLSVIKISFLLKMDVTETALLLSSGGLSLYSVRNPIDFICMYCQRRGDYLWGEVEQLIDRYDAAIADNFAESGEWAELPRDSGATMLMTDTLDDLINSSLPKSDAEKKLIAYMQAVQHEFTRRGTKKSERYLPGYSLTNRKKFLDLTKYLLVLYPEEEVMGRDKNESFRVQPVPVDDNGYPQLSSLINAMFRAANWCFDVEEYTQSTKSTEEKADSFNNQIFIFCKNYYDHINAVERVIRTPKNAAPVERRDVLLCAYFFLREVVQLSTRSPELSKLQKMTEQNTEFDACMGEILEWIMDAQEDVENNVAYYRRCLNQFLDLFDFMPLYLPLAFDRFILLALLSENTDDLVPLIMFNNRELVAEDLMNYQASDEK